VRQGPRKEQIDTARSEAARARAAVDYAKTMLDATEIRVPINGTILERNVERGEMVTTSFVGDRGAKSFVVTIADLDDIQVELDINQHDFNRIVSNQPCTVTTDAFPDRVYKCVVDEIAPEANRQKATVQVKVKFKEPDEYVRPEMNARVTFLEPEKTAEETRSSATKLFVIPKRAVFEHDGSKAIFVVVDGKVSQKQVNIAKEVGTSAFVSAGLSGTESVIVSEQLNQLKVGDSVTVK
jgi:HlyD family secretion protein